MPCCPLRRGTAPRSPCRRMPRFLVLRARVRVVAPARSGSLPRRRFLTDSRLAYETTGTCGVCTLSMALLQRRAPAGPGRRPREASRQVRPPAGRDPPEKRSQTPLGGVSSGCTSAHECRECTLGGVHVCIERDHECNECDTPNTAPPARHCTVYQSHNHNTGLCCVVFCSGDSAG